MASLKTIVKGIVLVISGIAIVVVGGFMMGAVARLWLPKGKKDQSSSSSPSNLDEGKQAD
jgi:uncharacterized membrane protein SpoIIM required for sporulation